MGWNGNKANSWCEEKYWMEYAEYVVYMITRWFNIVSSPDHFGPHHSGPGPDKLSMG